MSDTDFEVVEDEEKEVNRKRPSSLKDDLEDSVEEIRAEADEIRKDTKEIKEEVHELKEELRKEHQAQDDFKSKFYYLAAEMENMKKRFEREKESIHKFGSEKILSSLVEVVDNFERTIQAIENDEDPKIKNIYTGINMVKKQMLESLKKSGLEEVESMGKIFDPNFHEALAQQPADDKEEGEIVSEYQKGYILNGRLLRAAKVVIAKKN